MAIRYGPDGPGFESRWGVRLSTAVQTGSGAHPASCIMDTESLSRVQSGTEVVLTTDSHLSPRLKKE